MVLVEDSLYSDVARVIGALPEAPAALRIGAVAPEDIGRVAADQLPEVIVLRCPGVEQLEGDTLIASRESALLNVSFAYSSRYTTVQPWLILSDYLCDQAQDAQLSQQTALDCLGGRHPLPVGAFLGRPADRKPELRVWSVDGVAPDRGSWSDGSYSLGHRVLVLAREGRATGALASMLSDLALPLEARGLVDSIAGSLVSEDARSCWWGSEPEVRLTAVGDIMLARRVDLYMERYGIHYPLDMVKERLGWADLVVANLESPLGVTGRPLPGKQIWFRARPEAVEALVGAGVDLVSLANNHSMDYDVDNLLETMEILEAAGVMYVGAGRNITEARAPLLVERSGVRVAFLAYNAFAHIFWSHAYPVAFEAQTDRAGTAPLREQVLPEIRLDIAAARELADVVVVYYHWGREYSNYPTEEQVRWGRWTVEAGADLVLGSHPHAIQGVEVYQGAPIAYSLGNFVFDQNRPITTESMMLELVLSRDGVVSCNQVPVRIVQDQPRVLEGDEGRELMAKMLELARAIAEGGQR